MMGLSYRMPVAGALVLGGLFLAGCDGDTSKPGHSGRRPAARMDIEQTVLTSPPLEELPCGQEYKIELKVSRKGPCGPGYNFTDLDIRANDVLSESVAAVRCPGACAPSRSWVRYREHACAGPREAFSTVKASVVCPEAGAPVPPGLAGGLSAASTGQMALPGESGALPAGTPRRGETIVEVGSSTSTTTTLACGKSYWVNVVHEEADLMAGAVGIGDYQPYIDRAKARARMVYNRITCVGACAKQPFSPSYVSWTFDRARNVVVVNVTFQIICR
jgi:hypothetical protein